MGTTVSRVAGVACTAVSGIGIPGVAVKLGCSALGVGTISCILLIAGSIVLVAGSRYLYTRANGDGAEQTLTISPLT